MGDDRKSSLALVRRFVATHHPAADTALLAGSRARCDGSAHSDYDVVVLYRSLPDGAWRETVRYEGAIMEVFAHDLATLAYFCREVDRPSGKPVLPNLVAEGVPVMLGTPALLDAARRIAGETLRLGPIPLDTEALRLARYTITDLAAALHAHQSEGVRLALGATLDTALADVALRAAGHWGASGEAVPRALAALDPAQPSTRLLDGGSRRLSEPSSRPAGRRPCGRWWLRYWTPMAARSVTGSGARHRQSGA